MFFERMFGNLFGIIWLIIFVIAVFSCLIWMLLKREKAIIEENEIVGEEKELFKEEYKGFFIEENEKGMYEVTNDKKESLKVFNSLNDSHVFVDVILLRDECEREEDEAEESVYEIVEIDGFYKVRKKGNERTIRKFASKEEAINYVKEKETND